MQCPTCGDQPLHASMTQEGVEVDYCRQCRGVWLDKGEIFSFTKRPKELSEAFLHAHATAKRSQRVSPKTGRPMQEITFLDGKLVLDVCPETEGIWFDEGEIERLVNAGPNLLSLRIDTTVSSPDELFAHSQEALSATTLLRLPNLAIRAYIAMFFLYAPLALLLGLFVKFANVHYIAALISGAALVGLHWKFSPWFMNRIMQRVLPIRQILVSELPEHLQMVITRVCGKYGIAAPTFSILADSRPNIFTYRGPVQQVHTILTQGVLQLLDKEDQEVLLTRELGHAKGWNLRVMTVAYCPAWIISLLASFLLDSLKRTQRSAFFLSIPIIILYWLYQVASWPVRGFSRARHIAADRFAGSMSGHPNRVLFALVHTMQGMAAHLITEHPEQHGSSRHCKFFSAIGALGIVNMDIAQSFVISVQNVNKPLKSSNRTDEINMPGALKWELWNPWARYYEGHANHPLLTRRIRYFMNQADALGQEPAYRFSQQKPESYWNEFGVDLSVLSAPHITLLIFVVIAVLTQQQALLGLGLIMTGILAMVKFFFTYPKELFPPMTISSLFKHIKVSGIRPISCSLRGHVSSTHSPQTDRVVMRDYTGMAVLELLQPLRVWEFLFSALRYAELTTDTATDEITIEGWYRRSPVPYIEIKTMSTSHGTRVCHASTIRKFMILLVMLLGFVLAFVPLDTTWPLF